jgi:mono/diheme cytochrome c family protein
MGSLLSQRNSGDSRHAQLAVRIRIMSHAIASFAAVLVTLSRTASACVQNPRQGFRPLLGGALLLALCAAARGDDAMEQFAKKVQPLLKRKCFECHSSKADELKGNLKLESVDDILKGGDSGPAVKAGDVEESLLLKAIRYQIEDMQMPPSGKLDDEDIQLVEAWVQALGKK